jgi:Putative porin
MRRVLSVLGVSLSLLSSPRPAAAGARWAGFEFHADGFVRKEWTEAFGPVAEQDRWAFRLRPSLEFGSDHVHVGVGGDLRYGSDRNDEPEPATIRDNYSSRDARLDLAFLSLQPVSWLDVRGGRFAMPIPFTEMIWDRNLRPQGASVALTAHDDGGLPRFTLVGLWAKGSHVFADKHSELLAAAGTATFRPGLNTFELTAAYAAFSGLDSLDPALRRQNSIVAGAFAQRYRILDGIARFLHEGRLRTELVADYCYNTGADASNRGLWLVAVLGSTESARARVEYLYARVDKDAVQGAYAADPYLWTTGWEGHKADAGLRLGERGSLHGILMYQRFKDGPTPAARDNWVRRIRVELRLRY